MKHTEPHPLAGKTVRLNDKASDSMRGIVVEGAEFRIEDWVFGRMGDRSWMDMHGNPAALWYSARAGLSDLPIDDEVVYGKIGSYGHMVHVSELGEVVDD